MVHLISVESNLNAPELKNFPIFKYLKQTLNFEFTSHSLRDLKLISKHIKYSNWVGSYVCLHGCEMTD